MMADAVLVMQNGLILHGQAFGMKGRRSGEVVFNTSMVGFQEVITDPSSKDEIVIFTYPVIGNYGINPDASESAKVQASGVVVREWAGDPSNWRARADLDEFLRDNAVPGISGIDTRYITRVIRNLGTMKGILSSTLGDLENPEKLVRELDEAFPEQDAFFRSVGPEKAYRLEGEGPALAVIDLGIKRTFLRQLRDSGYNLTVFPERASWEEIEGSKPRGLLVAGGPGNPVWARQAVKNVREALNHVPVLGLGSGHHVLALALGMSIEKMKFGHRGANMPVKDLAAGRVSITAQNHGYRINGETLSEMVEVTHLNLNDLTVEGMRHREIPAQSLEYFPELGPDRGSDNQVMESFRSMIG